MPRLRARRTLEELAYRPDVRLTADAVYDLTFAATGDQEQAEEAWKRHRWQELKSGRTPA